MWINSGYFFWVPEEAIHQQEEDEEVDEEVDEEEGFSCKLV